MTGSTCIQKSFSTFVLMKKKIKLSNIKNFTVRIVRQKTFDKIFHLFLFKFLFLHTIRF